MFSASSLNSLLDKQGVKPEEILDDADLLQECKAQSQKLMDYLQNPEVLSHLLGYVVGKTEVSLPDTAANEEKIGFKYPYIASEVLSSNMSGVSDMILQRKEEFLYPYWDAILEAPVGDPEPAATLKPQTVGMANKKPQPTEDETGRPTVAMSALKKGPGHAILASYWVKVNAMLLEQHPKELLEAIKGMPNFVERIVAHFESPTLVDFVFRLIQTDETHPEANMVEWLSENDLIPHVVGLLSPYVSQDFNYAASEFLKSVISLSAPSPTSLSQFAADGIGGGAYGMPSIGISNLLVRELASEENVRKMVAFMLDYKEAPSREENSRSFTRQRADFGLKPLSEMDSSEESAVEDDEDDALTLQMNLRKRSMSVARTVAEHRDSMATVRPDFGLRRTSMARPVLSQQAQNSAFISCAGVFIELIRKNNSDYFEQHLFHTLRNYLQMRQHELSDSAKGINMQDRYMTLEDLHFDDSVDIGVMEQALAEVSEKMGIVHLGSLLQILAERIPDMQAMMSSLPAGTPLVSTTVGVIEPLTQIRYCISELYAELLHCSNMALMNREPGTGPQYSPMGTLQGGIKGIEALASALQGEDAVIAEPDEYCGQTQEWQGTHSSEHIPEIHTECDEAEEHVAAEEEAQEPARDRQNSLGVHSSSSLNEGEEDDDAKSIASALSSLSLADLIQQFASGPSSLSSENEEPRVLGDYLKRQLLQHRVIPLLLELFLKYPWNNFLHNVVYDIVQQLFNGDMQKGANRELTVSVFEQAHLIETIIEGARRNKESSKQPRRVRLGYMGHLNLIAEETVKLLERYPRLIEMRVRSMIPQPEWDEYLANELNVSRAKEAVQLAGGRPSLTASDMLDSDTEDYGDGDDNNSLAHYLSAQMRNGMADDDDDEDDHVLALRRAAQQDPASLDDDDWGPFADQDNSGSFEFSASNSATEPELAISARSENLTPADWAADFRRTSMSSIPASAIQDDDSDSEEAPPRPHRHRRRSSASSSSSSDGGGSGDDSPYVDLHHPALLRHKAHDLSARRPGVPDESQSDSQHWPIAAAAKKRRASSSHGDRAAFLAKSALPYKVEETEDGLLRRTLEDGTTVVVPLDDAELFESETSSQDEGNSDN
ncbi:hypothetical protein MCUN1_001888 [Malassezia cuniculi]|uniref:SAPS-domain-containing protein n=1 Tax=Malassezia cuniculi TaxID=948313 RepID=A0AAF0EUV0_9BASI|nr:hypothetical protein MCUN1_001888 [Malassezia cuniculi]